MSVLTLRKLITRHPERFYPQTWYLGERFLDRPLTSFPVAPPHGYTPTDTPQRYHADLVPAVELVAQYLKFPDHHIWFQYLWTADTDDQGQRVYVGSNGAGLEVHRHLHLTDRWGVPCWWRP